METRDSFSFPGGAGGSLPTWIGPAGSGREVYVTTGSGNGAVVSLAPSGAREWTETVLYSFAGGNDGAGPCCLVVGSDGTIYGVAGGGSNGSGIVFSLTPSNGTWIKSTLYDFGGGYGPSSLTLAPTGALVGTVFGEIDGPFGNVFELSPPRDPGTSWQYQLLYDFNQGGPSINPNNVVFGKGGHLYGTLEGGDSNSGAIFELR